MPTYLTSSHFYVWFDKFNQVLQTIGLPKYNLDNLQIEFSEKEEKDSYGTYSIDNIKDLIRDEWGRHCHIEEILRRIVDYETYRREIEILIQAICGLQINVNPDYIWRTLENWFQEIQFQVRVLGKYYNDDKKIVLYMTNIEQVSADDGQNATTFERAFIHELFHAYHYKDDLDEIICRIDYTSKVVKESLASAYEWEYCRTYRINGNNILERSWEKHSVITYPYSGAIELFSSKSLAGIKFTDIFVESLTDMDGALRDLLRTNDFYNIKNLLRIRRHVKKIDLRRAYDEVMKMDKVGVIAQREIPFIIGNANAKDRKALIHNLTDESYCKATFATPVAVLSTSQVSYPCGTPKYYAEPMIKGDLDVNYYLFMHWDKKIHLEMLLDWIWNHK